MSDPVAIPQVDVVAAAAAQVGGAALIDVREPEEYAEVRAAGAVLVPLGELAERSAELPASGPIYLICRSGGRSQRAAEFLAQSGFDVLNVAGGTLAWVEAGLPIERG